MKTDFTPHLQPRTAPQIRCGHTDCRYYSPVSDSCDYLLRRFERRGCPADADCLRYEPAGGGRSDQSGLSALIFSRKALDFSLRCCRITVF